MPGQFDWGASTCAKASIEVLKLCWMSHRGDVSTLARCLAAMQSNWEAIGDADCTGGNRQLRCFDSMMVVEDAEPKLLGA